MAIERSVFSVSEEKVAGLALISSQEVPNVRISKKTDGDGVTDYFVYGHIPLEREAIARIMQKPIGDEDYSWQETRDGLRDVGYPSRRIAKLSRSAVNKQLLNDVRDSATELAQTLSNNQDYSTRTANVPVFNYAEAQQYAANVLYTQTHERKLLNMLKSLGLDHPSASKLYAAINTVTQTAAGIKQLETITGMDLADRTTAQIQAMLGAVDGEYATELIHRLQYELFIGFPEQAHLKDGKLVGGTDDLTVLLRESDLPIAVPLDFTNVSIAAPKVGVSVGDELPDKDRKTGLARKQVTFYTEIERRVATPLLAWRTKDGKRELIFPTSAFEKRLHGVGKPSSLLGVALLAEAIGREEGIDYAGELRRRLKRAPKSLGRAGLFPLVATHQQQSILKHPYFEEIENLL